MSNPIRPGGARKSQQFWPFSSIARSTHSTLSCIRSRRYAKHPCSHSSQFFAKRARRRCNRELNSTRGTRQGEFLFEERTTIHLTNWHLQTLHTLQLAHIHTTTDRWMLDKIFSLVLSRSHRRKFTFIRIPGDKELWKHLHWLDGILVHPMVHSLYNYSLK